MKEKEGGGKYTSFGPIRNTIAVGGGGITSSSSVRKRLRGGRRRKEDIHIEGESGNANFKQNPIIATKQMVVVKGDEQTEEHLHQHQQEGGQGGSKKEVE
jgi:hypothetical protein